MNNLDNASFDFISKIKNLPSLPTIILEVNRLINDPKTSARDFESVIAQDQFLTAKLLKIVNSAFYSFPNPIDSISRAIAIIGFAQLQTLVTSIVVMDTFKDIKDTSFTMTSFWEHSIACAITARNIGIYKRVVNPEIYFTAGILHDIGKLILISHSSSIYQEVLTRTKEREIFISEAEKEIVQFSHEEIGAGLAKMWNLPLSLQEAIYAHHAPTMTEKNQDLVAIIHFSNIVIHALQIGRSGCPFVPVLHEKCWDLLNLPISAIEKIVEQLCKQMADVKQTFFLI